jgi:uncharacterized membrane protein YphA (DoxX/SURF4 family)
MHLVRPRWLNVGWRLVVRLVPAGLLLWAGLAKAFDRQGSILAIDAYDLVPATLVRPIAAILPWVEIGVALLLVAGLFVRFAGLATATLAGLFIVALSQAKARGLQIDCGCFGGGGPGEGVSWWDIGRDVLVLGAGIYLALHPRGPLQIDNLFADEETGDGEDREADETRAQARGG